MPKRLPFVSLVVGIRFEWQRIQIYNDCKPGQKVYLMQEPKNPHHKNAIMVYIGRSMVGYLPREVADRVIHRWPDWLMGEGVILARGENYSKKKDNRYSLTIKIERFD